MKIVSFLLLCIFSVMGLTSCDSYGKKVSKGPVDVYYKDGIQEGEAQHTADFLAMVDRTQNNNTTAKKSFQLCKKNDTVCIRMVAVKEKLAGVADMAFYAIGNMVSDSVFAGKPVNVELTDDKFVSFKTFTYKKLDFGADPAPEQ